MGKQEKSFYAKAIALILISNQTVIEEDDKRVLDRRAKLQAKRELEKEQERER